MLVVQTDHHLGNTVLSLPVIAALGRYFEAGVDLAVDARYAGLVGDLPGVRRVERMPAQRDGHGKKRPAVAATVRLMGRLAARRYEAVIDLAGNVRTGRLVRASGWGTRRRVGFLQARRSSAYTLRIDAPDAARTGMHYFDRYARLLGCIGRRTEDPWPEAVRLEARAEQRDAVAGRLAAIFPDREGPLVVLHPAAGIPWRCWPPERFAAVAASLVQRHRARVLIIGVEGDRARAEGIRSTAGEAAARVAFGVWPLPDLVALFERTDVLVSNESGPTHLAAAVGTPIATIFGPTSEQRWRPLPVEPKRLRVLRGAGCDPGCGDRTCVAGKRCLLELSAAAVLASAESLLRREDPLPVAEPPRPVHTLSP